MKSSTKLRMRAANGATTRNNGVVLPAHSADIDALVSRLEQASARTLRAADREIASGALARIQLTRIALRLAVNEFMRQRHAMPRSLRRALAPHIRAVIGRLRAAEHAERLAIVGNTVTRPVVH